MTTTLTSLIMRKRYTDSAWFQKTLAILGGAALLAIYIAMWWALVVFPLIPQSHK